jgi:DNA-directed RNA polymerase subunit M/transcription elongation factor TFIIS
MNHPLREYTRQAFANLIAPGAISRNAEISTLNWAVQTARHSNQGATWENPQFRKIYKNKVHWLTMELRRPNHMVSLTTEVEGDRVHVKLNLVNQLAYRLKTKELDVKNLAKYPAEVLWPEGPWAKTMMAVKERDFKKEQAKAQMDEDYVGQFKCGKCKSVKTTYYQMQTRSADEPMVRFLVLLCALFAATNSFYRQPTSPA